MQYGPNDLPRILFSLLINWKSITWSGNYFGNTKKLNDDKPGEYATWSSVFWALNSITIESFCDDHYHRVRSMNCSYLRSFLENFLVQTLQQVYIILVIDRHDAPNDDCRKNNAPLWFFNSFAVFFRFRIVFMPWKRPKSQ